MQNSNLGEEGEERKEGNSNRILDNNLCAVYSLGATVLREMYERNYS